MENKYYTPSIKEFHAGFEYETKATVARGTADVESMWNKSVFGEGSMYDLLLGEAINFRVQLLPTIMEAAIKANTIRVKYLDREDIESLGFGDYKPPYEYDHTWTLENIELKAWFNNPIPHIRIKNHGVIICDCNIKNISELKVLLKQLNIL